MTLRTRMDALVHGRTTGALALAVAGVLASAAAGAQQAPASDVSGAENLAEIVVTAQKREQKLQEVPISIAVVDAAAIDRAGGFNIEGLQNLVPSLNLRKTNVALNQSLFLRGVGTVSFAIAAQPSVAFVLDNVVYSSAGEAFGDMYDVDRMEVLRGPQGTLFGKNASAGVINVVSRRPGNEFGGYVDVALFQDDERRVKVALDTPVSDTLKGRTTAFWGEFDGYLDNVSTTPAGGKANGYDRKGIRTLWQWDPSDTVALTFAADWRESDDNCCMFVVGTQPTGGTAGLIRQALTGTDIDGDNGRKLRQDVENKSEETGYGASVQADISLGDYTLTSVTAYRYWKANEVRDGDYLDVGAGIVGINAQFDEGPQKQKTYSQELRIASPTGQPLTYVAGFYWSKTDADRRFTRTNTVCSPLVVPTLPPADPVSGIRACPAANWVTASGTAFYGASMKTLAAFGDGTYNVSDAFRLIAGVRWTQDDLSFFHSGRSVSLAPGVTSANGVAAPLNTPLSGDDKVSEVSGRAGVQWDVTSDLMSYATFSRGYKGPAFNVFFNMAPVHTGLLEAETANSYEVGLKSTLGGGRTVLNLAVFKADYKNYQANNFFVVGTTLVSQLTNAGDVSTRGVELDFLSKPNDVLTLSGGIAYTDAQIERFNAPPVGQGSPLAQKGDPLPFAPKWKGSLSAEWKLDFGRLQVAPGFTAAYQSTSYTDIGSLSPALGATLLNRKVPGYGTLDLTLAFSDQDDRYRLTLIGRNVTDESYAALLQGGGPGGSVVYMIPRDADRYFGAQFRLNFGGK